MLSDKRQQQFVQVWAQLIPAELNDWIEQQPDRRELYALLTQLEQQIGRYGWFNSGNRTAGTAVLAERDRPPQNQ